MQSPARWPGFLHCGIAKTISARRRAADLEVARSESTQSQGSPRGTSRPQASATRGLAQAGCRVLPDSCAGNGRTGCGVPWNAYLEQTFSTQRRNGGEHAYPVADRYSGGRRRWRLSDHPRDPLSPCLSVRPLVCSVGRLVESLCACWH